MEVVMPTEEQFPKEPTTTSNSKSVVITQKSFSGNLVPQNFDEAMRISQALCKSGLVPKELTGKPEACFVAIGFGMELGLPPLQSIQNIMIVNGRPTIWGDAALGLVLDSGRCEEFDEDPANKALKQGFGRCRVKRFGSPSHEVCFSIEDAKKARLWTKSGPWTDYPGRMLQMRARSWALRDNFPDILKGLGVREEVADSPGKPSVRMPQEMGASKPEVQEATVMDMSPDEVIAVKEIVGDKTETPIKYISPDQRQEILNLLSTHKVNLKEWKKFVTETFSVQSSAEIPEARFGDVVAWIDSQMEKAPE
jgi:hypothetical protein